MNYSEAEKYRNKYAHLVPTHFNLNIERGLVRREIMPLVISPLNDIGRIIEELCKNGGDNKKALVELDLTNRDLRVYAVAYSSYPEMVFEDLQKFVDDDHRMKMN